MIIYFCDRQLNILGHASTTLPQGIRVSQDKTVEDVESGVNSFECVLTWDDSTRSELEYGITAGNYILKQSDTEYDSLYQIIETESDTKAQEISLYAEDAGLDLINTVCPAVTLTNKNITQMLQYFVPMDWTISVHDAPTTTKTHKWDGESTCTERINSVVGLWDCELYFSFVISGLQVEEKILNIVQKRGLQTAIPQLRLNYDIDRIVTKTSIANMVTALAVTGGTPSGSDVPINLKGYSYSYTDLETGDVYQVDTTTGQMRNTSAMQRWSGEIDQDGLLVGSYSFDTTNKATLAGQARAELQKRCYPAVNYSVDFTNLPDDAKIGDRVNIIDDAGALYLEARLLQIETCEAEEKKTAKIGEFLLKEGGISEKVYALANDLANQREFDKTIQSQMHVITDTVGSMYTLVVESSVTLGIAQLSAKLLNGKRDVKTDFDPNWFKWILRSEDGDKLLGKGYTLTVDMNVIGYASTILCKFIRPQVYDLTDGNLTAITDENNTPIQVSYAGIYNQPVVTRNAVRSRAKALRSTVEVGDPTLNTEVNLYEHGTVNATLQRFWTNEEGADAGAHITEVTKEEFQANPQGGNLLARTDGIVIRDGMTELSKYTANGAVIGQSAETHTEIDYHSLQLKNKEQGTYLYVSDLRDRNGRASITASFTGDGNSRYFSLDPTAVDTNYTITVNGVEVVGVEEKTTARFVLNTAPTAGSIIVANYVTDQPSARAFTFGSRGRDGLIGANSTTFGEDCVASGVNAFATGVQAKAKGYSAVAEGNRALANGYASHAEGVQTEASGGASHAEGVNTIASGSYTHAQGFGTIAGYYNQMSMGSFNTNKQTSLLEIGNGTADTDRRNALEVDRSGNMAIAGTLSQASDKRLKEHYDYLGEDAVDFISKLKPAHFTKDGDHHVGFYAQDVKEADKWDCMTGEMNGYLTLGYTELIAPLVAYVQKLEERIAELEKEK